MFKVDSFHLIEPLQLGKVAVLLGGRSGEREVSLMSGAGVLQALRSLGIDAHPFDPAVQAMDELKGFSRAFINLHGRLGEDGAIQGCLEWLGIPYTGSGVMASAMAMDKVTTKQVWMAHQLPTPVFELLAPHSQSPAQTRTVPDRLGLPLIVKPPHEGSSLGVSKVMGYSDMQAAVQAAAMLDPNVLCEAFVDGDEVTCPVIGEGDTATALPVVLIKAPGGNYDYANKYLTKQTAYHCPSGLAAHEEAAIQVLAVKAYQALGCRGWGRADLMIRASDRQAFLLELNTSPGMTSQSLVPKSAAAAGVSYASLCHHILSMARLDHCPQPG